LALSLFFCTFVVAIFNKYDNSMIVLVLLTIILGTFIPLQTATNARLQRSVSSALVASFISFVISTILLAFIALGTGELGNFSSINISDIPWWSWTGGLFGAMYVAYITFLFRTIGSVQTIVLPIFGQLVFSLFIDRFGWFDMPQCSISVVHILSVIFVFVGVLLIVNQPVSSRFKQSEKVQVDTKTVSQNVSKKNKWLPQISAVFIGVILTLNSVANGRLGVGLSSALNASLISFIAGTLFLGILCLITHTLGQTVLGFQRQDPWWIRLGGIFGAIFVFGCTYLIPQVGVSALSVLTLLGQMALSLVIDKYGLFQADKKTVSVQAILGILIMLGGVVVFNFL
jgi:transporter family-2 protein